jgi:anthranilate synthase component 2
MGLAHRTRPIHGVPFHPEYIATEHGHDMIANFLDLAGVKRLAMV